MLSDILHSLTPWDNFDSHVYAHPPTPSVSSSSSFFGTELQPSLTRSYNNPGQITTTRSSSAAHNTSHKTSFRFILCPNGYKCVSQVTKIEPGHPDTFGSGGGQKVFGKTGPVQETVAGANKIFEDGCPVAGFRSIVNQQCVPFFSPTPDKSAEQCRPCKTFSEFGYDDDKCNNGRRRSLDMMVISVWIR